MEKTDLKKFVLYAAVLYVAISIIFWYALKISPFALFEVIAGKTIFHFFTIRKLAVVSFVPVFLATYLSSLLSFKSERNISLFLIICTLLSFLLYDTLFVKEDFELSVTLRESSTYENWLVGGLNQLPYVSYNGIELTLGSNCDSPTWMEKNVTIPALANSMEVYACTGYAGGDGARVKIYVDNRYGYLIIPSKSCNKTSFDISDFADSKIHDIRLLSSTYGICNNESQIIKYITFNSNGGSYMIPEGTDFDFTDINEYLSWERGGSDGYAPSYPYHDTSTGVELNFGSYCNESTWIAKEIFFPRYAQKMIFNVLTGYAGGDGVQLNVYVDDTLFNSTVIGSNFSGEVLLNLNFTGMHLLKLEALKYGVCSDEYIRIREIKME